MKIIRDGVEIELTSEELRNAYYEQEHIYDVMDIQDAIDQSEDYGDNLVNAMSENIDDIAYDMRKNIDKYDMEWVYARNEALDDFIAGYKRSKEYGVV